MKTLIHGLLFFCLLAVFAYPAFAQITITAADVAAQLAPGSVLINHNDSLTTTLNIGRPGATAWDFSALLSNSADTLTSVVVSTTPYFTEFPGATHALKAQITVQGISGIAYQYLKLDSSLVNPGNKGSGVPLPGITLELKTTNNPPDTTYALPSTIGSKWGSSDTSTQVITANGAEIQRTVKIHSTKYVVDAYGPMTIPGGTIHQALRIRKEDRTPGLSVSYIFLARDGASIQVAVPDTAAPDSGTITVKNVSWSSPVITPTDVAQSKDGIPTEFSLSQNYPNPFNPVTTIGYTVAGTGDHGSGSRNVKLVVYNLLGQEVATLVNEAQAPGRYSVRFDAGKLPSGIYLYRLQAGNYVETKRMLLLK